MSVLAVQGHGLSRAYRTSSGSVRAIDGIDLVVPARQRVAIMGPSGCGKSTLLSLIGGLESLDGGRLSVLGANPATMSDDQRTQWRRDSVGFIFQAYDLVPFLTAVENVALQCGIARRQPSLTPRALLHRLGLQGHEDKLPDQLSGGQKQRVGVGRCLIHQPSLVLADEPTGGLDSATSRAVVDILLDLTAEIRATVIVVTHDAAVAQRFDRTVTLRDGRVTADTAPELRLVDAVGA